MSFPWATPKVMRRDCDTPCKPVCPEECMICPEEFKCLQIEHLFVEVCPPSRLAQLAEKLLPSITALPSVRYVIEYKITNQSTNSVRLENIYASLASSQGWASVNVRTLLDCTATEYALPQSGDLLNASVCLQPCQSLYIRVEMTAKCIGDCTQLFSLGSINCTELNERLIICGTCPCDPPPNAVPSNFSKTHTFPLPQ